LGLSRSTLYYKPRDDDDGDLLLKRMIDELYTKVPFYGSRKVAAWFELKGYDVGRKRIQRLMREMGIEAIYSKPRTTVANPGHKIYPYLLRNVPVTRPNQVWSADITYVPIQGGFVYLVAVIDWFSRYVVSWSVSNTMDVGFCMTALEDALAQGRPDIFNTDQGSQFTSQVFTGRLIESEVQISMDGRGRAFDNIFVERLWRSVKYEDVYLKGYATVPEAIRGLRAYFGFYNDERLHQALEYRTPRDVHYGKAA
jgi:putative transposase